MVILWSPGLCRNIHVVTWSVQEYSCCTVYSATLHWSQQNRLGISTLNSLLINSAIQCSYEFLKVLYHRQCQYTLANEYHFDGANSIETTNHWVYLAAKTWIRIGKYFNREKMPRSFASKGFTAKLFPRNLQVGVRRPFTSTPVACFVWLLGVVGRTVASAASAVCYSYVSFSAR